MLLNFSSSLDNFGVGVSYGLRKICIPLSLNLFIAFLNSSGTFFSMLFGKEFTGFLRPDAAGYLGAFLLIGIGFSIIVIEFHKKEVGRSSSPAYSDKKSVSEKKLFSRVSSFIDDPFAAGILCSGKVKMKEGIILASALTLSNISTGIDAGMLRFSLILTTAAAFVFNVLVLYTGEKTGHYSGARIIKGISGITSGLLLIFIGLYETLG
ncbi:MAG: hypothetical protein A2Y97_02055 [Nitrospirae bacterium RBG_13_39_12]|nr:MAG: hypothetical protein A2Y97_02055 [Nitrospirae bacterium RBG_13_39_12]